MNTEEFSILMKNNLDLFFQILKKNLKSSVVRWAVI